MPAKQNAHRASANAIASSAREIKKAANKTWRLAPKAPMFTRKSGKTVAGKKKARRPTSSAAKATRSACGGATR